MRSLLSLLVPLVLLACAAAQTTVEKPRVFISDSQSWEVSGSSGGANGTFGSSSQGGARPQTAEIVKTFGERCPQVIVNDRQDKANYVVLLDHEGGKGLGRKDNKVAVFNSDGDSILSHSTVTLGNSVKDACEAIVKDWPGRASKIAAALSNSAASQTNVVMGSKLSVSSTPPGADIEVDGSFVGNTPSEINLASGDHSIAIKKAGFKDWQRTIKITGGAINISADLEKAD